MVEEKNKDVVEEEKKEQEVSAEKTRKTQVLKRKK